MTAPALPLRRFLCSRGSKQYADYQARIRECYQLAHSAELEFFHPQFLVLQDAQGVALGVAGVQSAETNSLFLESYFDASIEALLLNADGRRIDRKKIAEIGNFVSLVPGGMQLLFGYIEAVLEGMGFQCAVFTGTKVLRRGLLRAGYELLDLGPADGQRLGTSAVHWGSYYKSQPRICALFSRSLGENSQLEDTLPCYWSRNGKVDERVA
jgi:hypothetical protein